MKMSEGKRLMKPAIVGGNVSSQFAVLVIMMDRSKTAMAKNQQMIEARAKKLPGSHAC